MFGVGIIVISDVESILHSLIVVLLYVLIPAYAAYGTFFKHRTAIVVSLLFFMFQSLRRVSNDGLITHTAPISISVPFGDFANGRGFLIDFFAITMAIVFAWLLKSLLEPNVQDSDNPTSKSLD